MTCNEKIPVLRAVAVDLDDTLLRNDKSISPRTLAAWEACRARGVRLLVNTARSEQACARLLAQLRPDGVISNAGALVRVGETVVLRRTLPPATTEGLVHGLLAAGTAGTVAVETEAGYFWNSPDPPRDPDYAHAVWTDFSGPLPPALKVTALLPDADAARTLAARYPDCALVGYRGAGWKRFSPVGVDKGTGLLAALAALRIPAAQTAAFGDDDGDLPMLAAAGWGVAMGNSVPAVRAAARAVTEDNEHDGVAVWLERFLR